MAMTVDTSLNNNSDAYGSSTASIHSANNSAPPIPEKSRLRSLHSMSSVRAAAAKSRFTEHFDHVPPPELLESLADTDFHVSTTRKPRRQRTLNKTFRPFLNTSNSSTTLDSLAPSRPKPSISTPPLSSSSNIETRPPLSNGSVALSSPAVPRARLNSITDTFVSRDERPVSQDESDNEASSVSMRKRSGTPRLFSLNRAEVLITRLDMWQQALKTIATWLEETAKIGLQGSRSYYQRSLPLVNQNVSDEGDALSTCQAGLQVLTMHLAGKHKEFGKRIQHDFIPPLLRLRKECKDMIKSLKEEPDLIMDELLRRAETTRKSMANLNKWCKAADASSDPHSPLEHDPWLANLYVLRQLKREVDEENRLRELMVPLQRGTAAFEARVLEHVKPAIAFCYEHLAPALWDGSDDAETAPFKLLLDQLLPDHEWMRFYERNKKDLVPEQNPRKDYMNINYPNKLNPCVMTLAKGVLGRQTGVRKQFTERFYVLSQCGYLHQFTMDDKVSPERSYFIPQMTIIPPMDLNHLDEATEPFTFQIHRKATQVLQRDKVHVFRAPSREDLAAWCKLLCDVAGRTSTTMPLIGQPQGFQHLAGHGDPARLSYHHQTQTHSSFSSSDSSLSRPPLDHSTSRPVSVQTATAQERRASNATNSTHPTTTDNDGMASSQPAVYEDDRASIATARPQTALFIDDCSESTSEKSEISQHKSTDVVTTKHEQQKPSTAEEEDSTPSTSPDEPRATTPTKSDPADLDGEASRETSDHGKDDFEKMDRPASVASTVDESVYFSSTSAPPSPSASSTTSSMQHEDIEIPTLEDEPTTPRPTFYTPQLNLPHAPVQQPHHQGQ
ncbi:hypothetical protein BCR43DRAFT_487819 [Syncephalastrum racemosum]|uniref:PH domain-containing protein n=1 Tax=Syncephalastrum racemosum TaxID=13706 RepID=A0A1X2HHP7_SYNRA|nr:hypothetical protein BCR43DRAFT_487819 [Syncephalastrum racemosum]